MPLFLAIALIGTVASQLLVASTTRMPAVPAIYGNDGLSNRGLPLRQWIATESLPTPTACSLRRSGDRGSGWECGNVQFTGYLRHDWFEWYLDYAGARYYRRFQGRFTSPDPLLQSAEPANPQSWNRYGYVLNNPLRYVDPTGMKEISTEDCQKNPDCVSVPINIIYDRNAQIFDAKGNIQSGVQQKIDDQVAAAKDVYGDALVSFNLSYSAGEISGKGSDQKVTGTKPGINVVLTDSRDSFVPGGASERNGMALIRVNAGTSDRSTLPHELGHVLAGDTQVPRIPIIGALMNTAFDVRTDAARMLIPFYSPYHGNRFDPPPGRRLRVTNLFNNGAQRFRRP